MLKKGAGTSIRFKEERWADVQPDFETAHFLKGFGYPDGKFRFRPQWVGGPSPNKPPKNMGGIWRIPPAAGISRPCRPDRGGRRRASVPAGDVAGAQFPEFVLHRDAGVARTRKAGRNCWCTRTTRRNAGPGRWRRASRSATGAAKWCCTQNCSTASSAVSSSPKASGPTAHERGEGINVLTGADAPPPYGGAAVHDNKVWVRAASLMRSKIPIRVSCRLIA
jgi:hypothetical protein